MSKELQELQVRISDTRQQLDFAQAGTDQSRVAYLENELSAMLRDMEAMTGHPYVVSRTVPFLSPDHY